jgi:hypothetical protein
MKRCVTSRRIIEGDIEGTIKSGVRQWKGGMASMRPTIAQREGRENDSDYE